MATKIYDIKNVYLIDGTELEISPLKIKYLRELMEAFYFMGNTDSDVDSISVLLECARIAMKQYYPELSKSVEILEDNIDMPTMMEILELAAGIKNRNNNTEDIEEQQPPNPEETQSTWEELDLAKLESEVFTLGIWKNYDELESSLSIAELMAILSSRRELDYEEKKFLAAIQGVDIDANSGKGQKEWEDMKARVFSKGKATDSNDVLSLQGQNARKSGFGIGMGLDYTDLRDPKLMKN